MVSFKDRITKDMKNWAAKQKRWDDLMKNEFQKYDDAIGKGWIKGVDSAPINMPVLICLSDGHVIAATKYKWDKRSKQMWGSIDDDELDLGDLDNAGTHWMTFPEPPDGA